MNVSFDGKEIKVDNGEDYTRGDYPQFSRGKSNVAYRTMRLMWGHTAEHTYFSMIFYLYGLYGHVRDTRIHAYTHAH